MKTILVPTDYSETASNALQYAIELAKDVSADIVLVHTYHPPITAGEAPVVLVTPQDLHEEHVQSLKKLEAEVDAKLHSSSRVRSIIRIGFTGEEIETVATENDVDLIVMGITGAGKVAQALIGSNALTVIGKTKIPVLTIPKEAHYKPVQKIVLAFDAKNELKKPVLDSLKSLITLFNAELIVVDVVDPHSQPTVQNAVATVKLESALSTIKHQIVFPQSTNVAEELQISAQAHNADWLVLIPHSYNFLQGLFHKSNTKEIAFHTHTPLLTLHN